MKLFDATLTRLERSLDVRLLRHNVLSGNVANVDTPGYVPKDVDFGVAMANAGEAGRAGGRAVTQTSGTHMAAAASGTGGVGTEAIVDVPGESPGLDGNQVDLDRTMAALAENGLQYGASARAAGKKLAILRYVAGDGIG